MTRSVEIPEVAVEAAAQAACELVYPPKTHQPWAIVDEREQDSWRATVRAALSAALPYLAPAAHNHQPHCCCPTWQVAPDDHDYEPLGGRIERESCPGCPEHGSAPAVPQPVDREALRGKLDQLWGWAKSGKRRDGEGGEYYLMDVENVDRFTDAVLAVLAGEQEQVEK